MNALTQLYTYMFTAPAWVRRTTARRIYQAISNGYRVSLDIDPEDPKASPDVVESAFMNYGFLDADAGPIELDPRYEIARYPVQLYHHVASAVGVAGKDVVEVGCGRGGGAGYIAESLGPRSMTAIDLSPEAIEFAQHCHQSDNVLFLRGVAEALPLAAESVDVVVNVESSHCYDMAKFLAEVGRVLKVGGHLSWTDTRLAHQLPDLDAEFHASGLELVEERDITEEVLAALAAVAPRRVEVIDTSLPRPLRGTMKAMLGVPGTLVYEAYERRELVYLSKVFRKTEDTPVHDRNEFENSDWIELQNGPLLRRIERSNKWIVRYLQHRFDNRIK